MEKGDEEDLVLQILVFSIIGGVGLNSGILLLYLLNN